MNLPEKDGAEVTFSSTDSVVVVFEGPGDHSRRPRRPNNPREWPTIKPVQPSGDSVQEPPPENKS